MVNVADLMASGMASEALSALRDVATAAEACGVEPFLVGGIVRDLIIGATGSRDMDIALVGAGADTFDGIARLARGEIVRRSQFNTTAMRAGGCHFDLIMARSESYASPGSLPTVRQGTLEEDLARRDFSVNAMAVSLSATDWGELNDPQGGLDDLRNGTLRVMHRDSFRDDATRILRAARYSSRLSLRLSHETSQALSESLRFMSSISPPRIRNELERVFLETTVGGALSSLQQWGALSAIHPALGYDAVAWAAFSEREATFSERERIAVGYAILGSGLPTVEVAGVVGRLRLGARNRGALEGSAALSERISAGGIAGLPNSALAEILDPLPEYSVLGCALAAHGSSVGERFEEYLRCHREMRSRLTGGDIIALGVTEGPDVGRIRSRLRAARLDGLAASREDEEAFVLKRLKAPGAS